MRDLGLEHTKSTAPHDRDESSDDEANCQRHFPLQVEFLGEM
jgi:hypothetical protein